MIIEYAELINCKNKRMMFNLQIILGGDFLT